jgi:hypothetical protein
VRAKTQYRRKIQTEISPSNVIEENERNNITESDSELTPKKHMINSFIPNNE